MYYVLYKQTPTELKGKEDEGSFHKCWGDTFYGWHAQSLVSPTLKDAYKAVEHITCYGRQWRIVEFKDNQVASVQTSPAAPAYVEPPPKAIQEPVAPKIVNMWKRALPTLTKEQTALTALLFSDWFIGSLDQCTDEERGNWSRLILNSLDNEVYPFCEEMGLEEKGTDRVNVDYFMDHMRSDLRDVNMLRFFGFITAAQARQMVRDSWLLGSSVAALQALKLDVEVKGDDLLEIIKVVISTNEKSVADYKSGKTNAANSLLGQAMKRAKAEGKNVDPNVVKELILKTLEG